MKTIKDIICDFKNKFGLSGLWSKPTSYMEYEDVTNKVESYLESSLTSLLDDIEEELPGIIDAEIDDEFINGYNSTIKKVINIINSHR